MERKHADVIDELKANGVQFNDIDRAAFEARTLSLYDGELPGVTMSANVLSEDVLNQVGEEFSACLRRGEETSVDDYTRRFPQYRVTVQRVGHIIVGAEPEAGTGACRAAIQRHVFRFYIQALGMVAHKLQRPGRILERRQHTSLGHCGSCSLFR